MSRTYILYTSFFLTTQPAFRCAKHFTNTMDGNNLRAESACKPLTSVELRSLSHESRSSQDAYEMAVLGRAQELNVSTNTSSLEEDPKLNLLPIAQLQIHFDPGICVHTDEHLGNFSDVSSLIQELTDSGYDNNGTIGQAFMGS